MQKIKTQQPALVALVTGAARRIGAEIARTLHADGLNVVLHFHTSADEAKALCDELNRVRADSAALARADLNETAQLELLVSLAVSHWGRLDVLVNNASRFYRTHKGATTRAAWDDLMDTNLKAPFFLSQAAVPFLEKHQGCIVNIIDVHGERPMQDYSAYCISKAGMVMLTKSFAKEWGGKIRVNAVSPGQMIFPEGDNVLTDAIKQKISSRTAMKRIGSPAEIGKAVLFFVRGADYITGQVLAVDGGRSLTI
jgi:pteridine reductase